MIERGPGDAVGHVPAVAELRRALDVERPQHGRRRRGRVEPVVHLDDEHRQPEDVGGEDELQPLVVADLPAAGEPPHGGHPLGLGQPHLPGEVVQVADEGGQELGGPRVACGGPAIDGEIGDVVLGDQLHGILLAVGRRRLPCRFSMGQGVTTSRTAAEPVACRRHAAAASASGISSWATDRAPVAGVPEDRLQGRPPLVRGQRGVGVAEDLERPAAQHRGGELGRVTGGAAEVDQPPARRQHPAGGRGREAEHGVDDDVRGAPAGVLEGGGEGVDVAGERDDGVGPGPPGPLLRLRRPADGDDPAGPEDLRRGDGDLADGTPRPEDQHALARLQPAALGQRHPGGDGRHAEGRGSGVGKTGRQREDAVVRHQAALGEAAVAGHHAGQGGEEDACPGRQPGGPLDHPDTLRAGDVGRGRSAEVGRARRDELVQRHDRRRGHPDQGVPRGVGRIRVVPDDRRLPGGVQHSGAHGVPPPRQPSAGST